MKSINFRMRHRRSFINKTLELRKSQLTYSQIAKELKNKISRQTIRNWVKKYKKWKSKEVEIKVWCEGYWNKNFQTPIWVKSHYSTYKINI